MMGVLIPSAPVCALGQLPLISKGSLYPHPARLRRATYTLLCNCHWQLLDFDSLRGAPPFTQGGFCASPEAS